MAQQGGIDAPYTRFRGPVLVGQSSDFGIAAINGGSTAPLISFWNASEFGLYVNSSAQVTFVGPSAQLLAFTSASVKSASTAGATNPASFAWASTAFLSTAAVSGYVYIPQTTYQMSSSSGTSSGPTPTAIGIGAALVYNTGTNKLQVFSTVKNEWFAVTLTCS